MREETAVRSKPLTLLLNVRSLELNASTLASAKRPPRTRLLVSRILGLGVRSAERRVKRAGEGLDANVVLGLVEELGAAALGLAAAGRGRGRVGLLVVSVGGDDDDFEAVERGAGVGGARLLDVLAEETALELGDGVGRAGGFGVALDEDVEAGAGAGAVAEGGTGVDVVAGEFLEGKVSVALDSTVVVYKSLLV